jgi:hypothetical protein
MHTAGDPQVYPVCFQAELTGSGRAKPSDTTTFPAAYNLNSDSLTYKVSDTTLDHSAFVPPGPAVYGSGEVSSNSLEDSTSPVGGNTTVAAVLPSPSGSRTTAGSGQVSSVATSDGQTASGSNTSAPEYQASGSTDEVTGSGGSSSSPKVDALSKSASGELQISHRHQCCSKSSAQQAAKSTGTGTGPSDSGNDSSGGDCMAKMVCRSDLLALPAY